MISVIIPTYKSPEALDLCLRSAIEGQEKENELIAITDGYYNLNKYILDKYEDHISILDLEQNQGLSMATNLGVYNATNDNILIVNDDNVFPDKWDTRLVELGEMKGKVCAPNQIEPQPSMFKQFVIQDLGRDPKTFDLERYWEYEQEVAKSLVDDSGSTLPIYMNRLDFLTIGGEVLFSIILIIILKLFKSKIFIYEDEKLYYNGFQKTAQRINQVVR
jgi:glycosyltransferase involved in cell wall biosynthesis